ncbi:MAG: epoxyqueuosine reductase QueH [Clostridiales bacterium]|nr:epoxyqueuosine reductase QueH [Clostridiales bacterium]
MRKKLLLHACCAPCSCGVIDQVKDYDITLLFYNPNLDTLDEYNRRLEAMNIMIAFFNSKGYNLKLIAIPYNENEFLSKVQGFENEKEGGKRCPICLSLRLDFTAKFASENGYDIFASTLSVSPHKDYELINNIGANVSKKYNIEYLPNNFKKNNGFLNSIKISKEMGIYRQNYCGCKFAK